ncbi:MULTISPECIES: aldehyde dehydrogenase family protein [unclassified Sphingobium]|uniref:aldehyde dehydrogenase family protein n=1 Tax=unclassified Sphingobium TaxID=2611147 RepID=UPI000A785DC4|nr:MULTISPECIES: aldehyde dehydrogenase family protein [unclassified Sphingobium]
MTASARPLPADLPTGLFLDGRWRPAASGATFDVLDPATGELLAKVADASPAEGLAALDAAHDAFAGWSATAPRRRSDILRRAFDLVMRDADRIARLITLEMGKPLKESRAEVVYGAEFLRWFSEEAVRIAGRYGPSPEGTGTMTISAMRWDRPC